MPYEVDYLRDGLITAAGFLPVGFAKSSAGEYTFSIFAVVTIALLVSWVVAVIFTPYLGYKLLPDPKAGTHGGQDMYQRPFYRRVRSVVTWCITRRKTVIVSTALLFALAIYGFQFVQNQFFPSSNRPELLVDLWLPQGASFQATENEVKRLEQLLKGDPDVENFVVYVGNGSPRFYLPLDQQLKHTNFAQFVVMTKNNEVREQVLARLEDVLETEFTLLRSRVNRLENGPPVGYPVQFRVSGQNITAVRRIANDVAVIMREHPNTSNVHLDWNEQVKNIRLLIDQNKARAIGVSSQNLAGMLDSIFTGFAITQYRERDESIEVVARRAHGARGSGSSGAGECSDFKREMDSVISNCASRIRVRGGHHLAAQSPADSYSAC